MAKPHREKQARVSLDRLQETLESKEIKFHGIISKGSMTSCYKKPYNEYQEFLYNRALLGLSMYTKEEVYDMNWDKKKRIIKVHKKAQTLINLWKQEIINVLSNHIFKTIFPDSPITKELLEVYGDATDELHVNKMSFRSLNITKTDIVERFIESGILPKNFNQLIPKTNDSGISSKRDNNTSVESREHIGGRAPEVSVQAG